MYIYDLYAKFYVPSSMTYWVIANETKVKYTIR
jgi:hypothetical protein